MSKKIHGITYMLIDVVVIGEMIYEIYENAQGHRVKIPCDYLRQ